MFRWIVGISVTVVVFSGLLACSATGGEPGAELVLVQISIVGSFSERLPSATLTAK